MTEWIKMRTGGGQFYDPALGVHIRGDERVPCPDPLPAGSLTARHLDVGGLIYCDPPEDADDAVDGEAIDDNAETDSEAAAAKKSVRKKK